MLFYIIKRVSPRGFFSGAEPQDRKKKKSVNTPQTSASAAILTSKLSHTGSSKMEEFAMSSSPSKRFSRPYSSFDCAPVKLQSDTNILRYRIQNIIDAHQCCTFDGEKCRDHDRNYLADHVLQGAKIGNNVVWVKNKDKWETANEFLSMAVFVHVDKSEPAHYCISAEQFYLIWKCRSNSSHVHVRLFMDDGRNWGKEMLAVVIDIDSVPSNRICCF